MPWSYTKRQIKRMPYQSRDVPLSGAGWNICCMPVVPGQQDEKDMEKMVKGKISSVMVFAKEKPCPKMT